MFFFTKTEQKRNKNRNCRGPEMAEDQPEWQGCQQWQAAPGIATCRSNGSGSQQWHLVPGMAGVPAITGNGRGSSNSRGHRNGRRSQQCQGVPAMSRGPSKSLGSSSKIQKQMNEQAIWTLSGPAHPSFKRTP